MRKLRLREFSCGHIAGPESNILKSLLFLGDITHLVFWASALDTSYLLSSSLCASATLIDMLELEENQALSYLLDLANALTSA